MQVCALNTKTQVTSCIKTKAGQTKYLIQGLVTAEYQVLANLTSSELRVVGHMLQVQLIRAPCPALLSVLAESKRDKNRYSSEWFLTGQRRLPNITGGKKTLTISALAIGA